MFWRKLFNNDDDPVAKELYAAIVAHARAPHWYVQGGVPDSVDGRFDIVATILALVLLRLERDPGEAAVSARLTERFITDMDGQLRQIGIGDVTVGKHIGQMMSMLGGRLGAYRDGLAEGSLNTALVRNLYRGTEPEPSVLAYTSEALARLVAAMDDQPAAAIVAGTLPE